MIRQKKQEYLIISVLPLLLIIYSMMKISFLEFLEGMKMITLSDGVLLADNFKIAGTHTSLINASIITLINIVLLYKLDMKINGLVISGIFLMLGFSLIGKNLINIIPFYVGAYLYALYNRQSFKSIVIICMFSTCLSPIVSSIAKLFNYTLIGIILAFILGVILGFIVPPISTRAVQFHGGYSLYNTGLSAGLVAVVFYSIMKNLGINMESRGNYLETQNYEVMLVLIIVFLFYIFYGFKRNNYSFDGYSEIFSHSGRLVTDFTVTEGVSLVFVNIGILGLVCTAIIFFFFPVNGPILCGLLTVVGFGGFGKHLKNVLPVMFGVMIAYYFFGQSIPLTNYAIIMFFSTTLAPISGKFGFIIGILVGFLNYCVTLNVGVTHGGLNLYNTGFSAGILASVCVPILQIFFDENKKR